MQLVLVAAFERIALACPFCGGKGARGLLENLVVVVGLCYLGRRSIKAMGRRRPRAQPPAADRADLTEPSRSR